MTEKRYTRYTWVSVTLWLCHSVANKKTQKNTMPQVGFKPEIYDSLLFEFAVAHEPTRPPQSVEKMIWTNKSCFKHQFAGQITLQNSNNSPDSNYNNHAWLREKSYLHSKDPCRLLLVLRCHWRWGSKNKKYIYSVTNVNPSIHQTWFLR